MIGVTASASAILDPLRGQVDPYVAGPVVVGVFAGAVVTSRIAHRVPTGVVQVLFVVVLCYTAVEMGAVPCAADGWPGCLIEVLRRLAGAAAGGGHGGQRGLVAAGTVAMLVAGHAPVTEPGPAFRPSGLAADVLAGRAAGFLWVGLESPSPCRRRGWPSPASATCARAIVARRPSPSASLAVLAVSTAVALVTR